MNLCPHVMSLRVYRLQQRRSRRTQQPKTRFAHQGVPGLERQLASQIFVTCLPSLPWNLFWGQRLEDRRLSREVNPSQCCSKLLQFND